MSKLPKWTPFHRAYLSPVLDEAKIKAIAETTHQSIEKVRLVFEEETRRATCYLNSRYQVNLRDLIPADGLTYGDVPPMVWLSIKRIDKGPVGIERFRDFQRIKNELVGPECEAVEIYPAESRLADSANQYHLWCFTTPGPSIPFGFSERLVVKESGGGAKQQAFEDDDG